MINYAQNGFYEFLIFDDEQRKWIKCKFLVKLCLSNPQFVCEWTDTIIFRYTPRRAITKKENSIEIMNISVLWLNDNKSNMF